ncbi:MAG: hypothetical protein AABY13_05965 [Nanoarchaeota archaeon]
MALYDVRGFYIFGGTRGTYAGELEINKAGKVQGIIIDDNSQSPERDIDGMITPLKKPTNWAALTFLKKSRDRNLADLLYEVKGVHVDGWNGTYTGTWQTMSRVELLQITNSFESSNGDTIHEGVFERFIPNYTGKEYAELVLTRQP